jgi:hypothetical protein
MSVIMTMKQTQRKLARILRDLDAISTDFYWRRFPYDCEQIDNASGAVAHVCMGFLDEGELERLAADNLLDELVGRPEPYSVDVERKHLITPHKKPTKKRKSVPTVGKVVPIKTPTKRKGNTKRAA